MPAPHEAARTATAADVAAIVPLVVASGGEKQSQKGGPLWFRRERRWREVDAELISALSRGDHEVAVGTIDDVVVGYGLVRTERLGDGSVLGVVDDIFVDEAARSVGVGEAVMDHLIGWCRAQGCFGVDSLALPGDRSTKNFFESFGLVARAIIVHKPLD
ncbi:MAG TPA: GNAT family N-acetyltransferase [Acidimicrobiales bacterium]|nr:GNAT family N-acetyltransferase [Acidimicrobiales bacterium]